MPIKFLVLGGDFCFFLGGGAPILFLWARGFSGFEPKFVIFAVFIKPQPLFGRGQGRGLPKAQFLGPRTVCAQTQVRDTYKEGKSATNLSNLGNFGQIWPRAIYLC